MNFIDFLESHLGKMERGTHFEAPAEESVNVAVFAGQPVPNAITYVTTGLSKHVLHQAENAPLRMELLGCVWSRFKDDGFESLLHILAREILERHHAPPRGFVSGPAGPITPGSTLEAFYFMHPAYHPEELEIFGEGDDRIYIVWPVPISASEASFIRCSGWSAFDELIFRKDPDFMDLGRRAIV